MGEQINPEAIERLADAPAAIQVLLNTVEELLQPNQALRDEVQMERRSESSQGGTKQAVNQAIQAL